MQDSRITCSRTIEAQETFEITAHTYIDWMRAFVLCLAAYIIQIASYHVVQLESCIEKKLVEPHTGAQPATSISVMHKEGGFGKGETCKRYGIVSCVIVRFRSVTVYVALPSIYLGLSTRTWSRDRHTCGLRCTHLDKQTHDYAYVRQDKATSPNTI